MLRELGLGIVLMLGGDGESARQAGEALIRDQIDDAIAEGAFEDVTFDAWRKGFDGGRFWLAFTDVSVEREEATLEAGAALVYPMTVELEFERGAVTDATGERWRFGNVRVNGSYSMFGRSVALDAAVLRRDGERVAPLDCLFEDRCRDDFLDPMAGLDALTLDFATRGSVANLEMVWRRGDECVRVAAEDIAVARRSRLNEVGAGLLAGEYDATMTLEQGECVSAGKGEALSIDAGSTERARWSDRSQTVDGLLRVLLVTVPGSYEYLVE